MEELKDVQEDNTQKEPIKTKTDLPTKENKEPKAKSTKKNKKDDSDNTRIVTFKNINQNNIVQIGGFSFKIPEEKYSQDVIEIEYKNNNGIIEIINMK